MVRERLLEKKIQSKLFKFPPYRARDASRNAAKPPPVKGSTVSIAITPVSVVKKIPPKDEQDLSEKLMVDLAARELRQKKLMVKY